MCENVYGYQDATSTCVIGLILIFNQHRGLLLPPYFILKRIEKHFHKVVRFQIMIFIFEKQVGLGTMRVWVLHTVHDL